MGEGRSEVAKLGCVCACVWDKSRAHGSPSLTQRGMSHRRFPAVWLSRSLLACGGIIRQQGTVIWIALQQVPGIESTRAPDEVQLTCSLYTLLPRPGFFTLPSYVSFPPLLFLSSLLLSLFSVPLEKARLVSPQRALLQVPDWLLNWHSLKYPSNACRERYVWTKRTCWRQHQHQHQQQQQRRQRQDRRRWRCQTALRNGLYC